MKFLVVHLCLALIAGTAVIGASASKRGLVEGITDCGSSGQLGDVHVEDCVRTPCHFTPLKAYDISLRFIASRTSASLELHVYVFNSEHILMELPINGEIQAGILYELTFQLPVTTELAGSAFDISLYILDVENFFSEICARASVVVEEVTIQ